MVLPIVILSFLALQRFQLFVVATISNETFIYGFNCTLGGKYTPKSTYQFNLFNLLGSFTTQASNNTGFYSSSLGDVPDKVYGLYMCRGDVNTTVCSDCVTNTTRDIVRKCPYQTRALIWYEHCMLRYSDQPLSGVMAQSPRAFLFSKKNVTGNQTQFAELLKETMGELAAQAAAADSQSAAGLKFATKVVPVTKSLTLYALEQCTPDLTADDCMRCLKAGIGLLVMSPCGRVLLPSCNIRFEIFPFFDTLSPPPIVPNGKISPVEASTKKHVSVTYVLIAILIPLAILTAFGIWVCVVKNKAAQNSILEVDGIRTGETLQFELSTIRAATRNFSADNKLGEGGFGEVYKGLLNNGQEVAIKRLSKDSRQGVVEFKNEVVLVAKLQHKNLVKLLGFCSATNEKILVYEFLPNSSLDRFLFDSTKKLSLDWETRFKIIVGIARGILYLHEDSRLKIIHRDLKSGNILLDEDMNPKISDFGLARLFGGDQTQDDTKRIVGT